MSRGCPWVTPFFMWRKWPVPPVLWITKVSQWRQQLNIKHASLGHFKQADYSMDIQFYPLNALHTSMGRNPQPYYWECCWQSSRISWIHPSSTAYVHPNSWYILKFYFASGPANTRTHLEIIYCRTHPTPTVCTPMCLYIPMRPPDIKYQYASHGGLWLNIYSKIPVTICQSSPLSHLKCKRQC